jgi:hypothetical protein
MGLLYDLSARGTSANWFTELDEFNRQEVMEWMEEQFNIDLFYRAIYRITFHILDVPFIVVYEYERDGDKLITDEYEDENGRVRYRPKELQPQTLMVSGDFPLVIRELMKSES